MLPLGWLRWNIIGIFYFILKIIAQEYCDQCDCSISENIDDVRGVRNVKPTCNEGKISWISPYGAVRIELHPGYSEFKACFIIETSNIRAQVSQESWENSNFPLSQFIPPSASLKPLLTANGRTKEYCVSSSSSPVLLFIEPERTTDSNGLSKIVFQYDVSRKSNSLYYNPMEECRPCTDKELIRAYCSSDFVIRASMEDVKHLDDIEKTEISVSISRIVRQKSSDLFYRKDRNSPNLQGKLHTPRKCDVSKGPGSYLFTGRLRLGQLFVTCAPYIEDWEKILHNAIRQGTMECSLD